MKKRNMSITEILSWTAIAGNLLFILWGSYNAIDEHFSGTIYQKLSYVGLMGLLLLNIILILFSRKELSKKTHSL